MEIKIFEQNTCESCLSVCLMSLLKYQKNIKLKPSEEYNIMFEGLKFTKLDFATGHLMYMAKKFPEIIFEQYVDYSGFCKLLAKFKLPKNIKLISNKINLNFLK